MCLHCITYPPWVVHGRCHHEMFPKVQYQLYVQVFVGIELYALKHHSQPMQTITLSVRLNFVVGLGGHVY